MSLKKISEDDFVIRCDGENCDNQIVGCDFWNALDYAKEDGWKVVKGIEWNHYCLHCAGGRL